MSASTTVKDSSIPCEPVDESSDCDSNSPSETNSNTHPNKKQRRSSPVPTSSADTPVHKNARAEPATATATIAHPSTTTINSTNSATNNTNTTPSEDELTRQERLHSLDALFDAFNICDIESLFGLVQGRFAQDLIFSLGSGRESYIGQNPLFTYWNFAHEIYPDAMVKILERRIISVAVASTASSSSSSDKVTPPKSEWRVECVYKFTGTRITGSPIYETFSNFMVTCGDTVEKATKYEELALSMVRFITANNAAAAAVNPALMHSDPDEAKSCIVEVVLSFDDETQLIKEWSMELLAGDER